MHGSWTVIMQFTPAVAAKFRFLPQEQWTGWVCVPDHDQDAPLRTASERHSGSVGDAESGAREMNLHSHTRLRSQRSAAVGFLHISAPGPTAC
jgi:hypothetical protein